MTSVIQLLPFFYFSFPLVIAELVKYNLKKQKSKGMQTTLLRLQESRRRRSFIIATASTISIVGLFVMCICAFFGVFNDSSVYLCFALLFSVNICVLYTQMSSMRKETTELLLKLRTMITGVSDLLESFAKKELEFKTSVLLSEEEQQQKNIECAQFVFVDILDSLVKITGVVPDEPVFLEITRREQVEELLSVVRGILMESLLSLTLLDAKIKGSDWGRDALKHLKNY